ncbi:MAG: hypothetical protein ACWA5L_08710 [bacterium]
MLFFKSKKKVSTEEVAKKLAEKSAEAKAELKEELEASVVPDLKSCDVAHGKLDVKLFPGLEDQPFEIGYADFASADFGLTEVAPTLVIRWKEGKGEWFPMPDMFNKVLLDRIHQRETSLDTILSDYGYQISEARPSAVAEDAVQDGEADKSE